MRAIALSVAASALLALTPAQAQTAEPPIMFDAPSCPSPHSAEREAADQAVLEAAFAAFDSQGWAGLAAHATQLQGVVDGAPDCFPLIERRGEEVLVRGGAPSAATTLALLMTATVEGRATRVVEAPNTYIEAPLALGALAAEHRNFEEAIRWLDRGLALQPHQQQLSLEKAVSLMQLHRYQEAVDTLQGVLDHPEANLTLDRARITRNLGIALIDVDRLDDAEAALNESIRLQPNNPVARRELEYIAQLRAGGARAPVQMTGAQASPPANEDPD